MQGAYSPTTPSLWRHADFVKLWIGQTVSLFGSSLSHLALQFIAAVSLNATPAEMGILGAVHAIPTLIVGLISGVWVDRYKRRSWLIAGDIGRAALYATIPIAAFAGVLSMPQLYLVGFLAGILSVFFDVASQSYLPTLIDRDQLIEGNSKLGMTSSLTTITGLSLAGLIIQAITAPLAVILDALSYLFSAACVILIRKPEPPPEVSTLPLVAQLREGLGLVFRNPTLRALAGCLAMSNFTSNIFFALYILFGTRDLGMNAAELGLVYGIGASGALIGAVAGPRLAQRVGVGNAIVGGAILGSLEVMPVVFASPTNAVPVLLLSSMMGNLGWVVHSINATSLRQAITPVALQGRMNGTLTFLVAGMLPLGALAGGALGQVLGLREAITFSAIASAFSFLWVFFSPVRRMKRMPESSVSV